MSQIKVGNDGLTVPQKVVRGQQLETTVRASGLASATAMADTIKNVTDALADGLETQVNDKKTWLQSADVQHTLEIAYNTALVGVSDTIQTETGGVEALILNTGFGVRETSNTPKDVAEVHNLTVTVGDNAGELDIHFDGVANATGYAFQWLIGAAPTGNWNYGPPIPGKKSKYEWTGLTSGQRYWVRVQATNAAGTGPWSDPISRIAP